MSWVDAGKHGAGKDRTPEENRVAMLAAIAEAQAAGGGTVFLPEGAYAVKEALPPEGVDFATRR
jgi:polygalacturonase